MKLLTFLSVFIATLFFVSPVSAQEESLPMDEFMRGQVVEIIDEGANDFSGVAQPFQTVLLNIKSGSLSGQEVEVEHGTVFPIEERQKVVVGDTVVLTQTQGPQGSLLVITDTFRLGGVAGTLIIFAVLLRIFIGKSTLRTLAVVVLGIGGLIAAAPTVLAAPTNPTTLLLGSVALILLFCLRL